MEQTIFEKIIAGEIPCTKVYEDEQFFAFLDINPVTKGHTLLLPKKPIVWMQDVDNELIAAIFVKAKELMIKIKGVVACDYVQVVVEGVSVPHFHIHLIPGYIGHKSAQWEHVKYENKEEDIIAEKIRASL